MTNEQAIKRIILINGQSELFALTIRKLKQPRAPYQSGVHK